MNADEQTASIVDELCKHGLVRSQNYPIEFVFYGAAGGLAQLREAMLCDGFTEDLAQSDEMAVFLKSIPLDLEHIALAKLDMEALASKFGVAFDGWSIDGRTP